MKKFFAFILLCAILIGAGCRRHSEPRELSEYEDASTGDSLLYYYLQMKALEYWNRAATDTSLRSEEQRQRFLDGVEEGIALVGDDDTYNQGLRLGVRLANNLREFEKKYDVDLNNGIMIASLRRGLQDDDIAGLEDQKEFYRLLGVMKEQVKQKSKVTAAAQLEKEAKKQGLEKLSDRLYYTILRPGSGRNVTDGDVIELAVDYQRTDGDNLGLPSPIVVTVGGDGVPMVMDEAYRQLKHGTTAKFATTAYDLFGSRTGIMGLLDSDIVVVSMILNDIHKP